MLPTPDDEALAGHEARHRLDRADGAGVGEADGGAGEVVGRELVVADLADELLVGRENPAKSRVSASLMHRHEQRAAAVGLLDVDGEPRLTWSLRTMRGLPSAPST
jgi:hypothetical protein